MLPAQKNSGQGQGWPQASEGRCVPGIITWNSEHISHTIQLPWRESLPFLHLPTPKSVLFCSNSLFWWLVPPSSNCLGIISRFLFLPVSPWNLSTMARNSTSGVVSNSVLFYPFTPSSFCLHIIQRISNPLLASKFCLLSTTHCSLCNLFRLMFSNAIRLRHYLPTFSQQLPTAFRIGYTFFRLNKPQCPLI